MTMLLAHPAAEDLGRFIEGTLDDAGRAAVVDHIADCDECRVVVVDGSAFGEESAAATGGTGGRWWLAVAAAFAIVVGSAFIWNARRDPLAPLIEASAQLASRPVEARLSGFPHLDRKTMRGGDEETDAAMLVLQGKAYEVLERRGDDPRMQHAKGIALLLAAQAKLAGIKLAEINNASADDATGERKNALAAERRDVVVEKDRAVAMLQSAAIRVPDNANYQSDLAVALIATGDMANLNRAVDACDQALRIDRRSPEALFNRAIALRDSNRKDAIEAFQHYLEVDSSSPWAAEARQNIEVLKQGP